MAVSRGAHTDDYSQDLRSQNPAATNSEPQPSATFPEDRPRPVGLIQILMESLLFPGTHCTWKPVCAFQMWSLCFPQSCGVPVLRLHWPSMPNVPGAPPPSARLPRLGNLTWGSELSLLWESFCDIVIFQSVHHQWCMGMLILWKHPSEHLDVTSLSLGV